MTKADGGEGQRDGAVSPGNPKAADDGLKAPTLGTAQRAVALADLAAAAYMCLFWYVALGTTPKLLLPDRSRLSTTILALLVYAVPVVVSAVIMLLRPSRRLLVVAAALPIIPMVPLLAAQARADFYWLVAVGIILLATATVAPLVVLARSGKLES